VLYLLGHGRLPREAAEALTLAPVLALAAKWWLERKALPHKEGS
jgi:hypothetical protein